MRAALERELAGLVDSLLQLQEEAEEVRSSPGRPCDLLGRSAYVVTYVEVFYAVLGDVGIHPLRDGRILLATTPKA